MEYNFPDHISGDTFNGTSFTVKVNGSLLDLTGASVAFIFGVDKDVLTLSTLNGKLTLSNTPTDGVVTFPRQVITLPVGTYKYRVIFTLRDGSVKTYITGQWVIVKA